MPRDGILAMSAQMASASSEYSQNNAMNFNFNGSSSNGVNVNNNNKYNGLQVRPFLAFRFKAITAKSEQTHHEQIRNGPDKRQQGRARHGGYSPARPPLHFFLYTPP